MYEANASNKKRNGFTIVELLIIIVVIGILAALVVSVFSGMQVRARNQARNSAANEYIRIVRAYIIQNGEYPATFNYCLGEGYTDSDGDGDEDCGVNGSSVPNTSLNNRLKTISATLPTFDKNLILSETGETQRGIRFSHRSSGRIVDGIERPLNIVWFLEGSDQD